jgi:murein DD-endopeptidase MepM/ murein hydrolase activator NlpD
MFYCYLADVIAVADGEVTALKTDVATNVPQPDGSVLAPMTRENGTGNLIGLRIDGEHYAFYAHLEPGSIRVTLGQKVKKGDVLAKVGNTGNASGPHLHFHIADSNNLNGSQGLPYVFERFELEGMQSSGRPREAGSKRTVHTASLPADDCVVWFGGDH